MKKLYFTLPPTFPKRGFSEKTVDNYGQAIYDNSVKTQASVAQLDSASVFGTEGWGFESLQA